MTFYGIGNHKHFGNWGLASRSCPTPKDTFVKPLTELGVTQTLCRRLRFPIKFKVPEIEEQYGVVRLVFDNKKIQ